MVCPNNSDLVAYCYNGDIWLLSCNRNESHRLTFSSDILEVNELNPITAGLPSYVIQEEFSRYEGFWWQPHSEGNSIKYDRNFHLKFVIIQITSTKFYTKKSMIRMSIF